MKCADWRQQLALEDWRARMIVRSATSFKFEQENDNDWRIYALDSDKKIIDSLLLKNFKVKA